MIIHPFYKKLNLNQYIQENGDLNCVDPVTGKTLTEFLFSRISKDIFYPENPIYIQQVRTILCHEQCYIHKNKIQKQLLLLCKHLTEEDFKIEKDRKNFIQRFDLLHEQSIPFLHHFISNPFTIFLFFLAQKYHPDFKKALLMINKLNGENLWHKVFFSISCNSQQYQYEKNYQKKLYEIIPILSNLYSIGIHQKNNDNNTPIQEIEKFFFLSTTNKKIEELSTDAQEILLFLRNIDFNLYLQNTIPINKSENHFSKI